MDYVRCNTDWMAGNFGISSHWTNDCIYEGGRKDAYRDAVEAFDVDAYANALFSVGAKHCIFTLTHAQQYLAMPNAVLDGILPGRTTRRDLIGELIEALSRCGIRLIAYYNHSCNGQDDLEWKAACGYADGPNHHLDRFAENIVTLVEAISLRYGDGLAGWWFDSGYSVDLHGPCRSVTCDMGNWQFPWQALNQAAKAGFSGSAVAVNAGVGRRFLYTECQDYYAGETTRLDDPFAGEVVPGLRDHRWICQDSPQWVFASQFAESGFVPPQFEDAALKAFVQEHLSAGRMVTLNILTDRSGRLNPLALEQLRRILR